MIFYTRLSSFVVAVGLGLFTFSTVDDAQAALIFSENFNSLSGSMFLANSTSERGPGDYLDNTTLPSGWTKEGNASQILGFDREGDKAVVLNEGAEGIADAANGISRTITGLLPGMPHVLAFEYWGDNITAAYSFSFEINSITTPVAATHSGQNSGTFHTQLFSFTPLSDTTTLRFTEHSLTQASPLIDNITIEIVPEPSTLVIFTLGGLGLLLYSRRRVRGSDKR